MTNEAPVLQRIEDAPEGVPLMLWLNGSPHHFNNPFTLRNIKTYEFETPDGRVISTDSSHFTLWPVPAKEPDSWDDFLCPESGSFIMDSRYIAYNAAAKTTHGRRHLAARDFLNHHYPVGEDT